MLAAPVPPLPEGTPPPHHNNRSSFPNPEEEEINYEVLPSTSTSSQTTDVFMYKSREVKSAPAPPTCSLQDFAESQDNDDNASSVSSSCSSLSYSNNNASSTTKIHKISKDTSHCRKCCSCLCSCTSLLGFFFGNAPTFTSWSTSYSSTNRLKYLSLFFLESSLRSIGDIAFCGNPFSGLLIFTAMLISCPLVAFLAFVTLTIGIETAIVFFHVPMEEVRSGVVTFNSFLTGAVIALIAEQDVILVKPDIIVVCIVVGILGVVIWKGLNGVLVTSYLQFPMLNAPFHVMVLLYVYSGMASRYEPVETTAMRTDVDQESSISQYYVPAENNTGQMHNLMSQMAESSTQIPPFTPLDLNKGKSFEHQLDWERLLYGVLLAPGQVFGTNTLVTSGMVYAAIFIYSPIMWVQSLTGSAIGTLIGLCLTNSDDYEALYNGSWGYNPLFTMAAIGGFFVVFNFHSWLLSIFGGVITTLLYSAMINCKVPAFGIPFMLVTWLVLPSIPPLPSMNSMESTKPSNKGDVVVNINNETNEKIRDAFEVDVEKNEQNDNMRIDDKHLIGPFIRLYLSQITTPENHRRDFHQRKSQPHKRKSCGKIRSSNGGIKGSRISKEKAKDKQDDLVSSVKNGVMNKYKSSISESPFPVNDQLPPELSLGVEQNSILPL